MADRRWLPGDLHERLHEDGFARIPDAIGPLELRGLSRALGEVVASRPRPFHRTPFDFEHGGRGPDGSSVNGDALYRVKYSLDKHRRFLTLLANPIVLMLAAELVGGRPMIVCWEDLMVKEAAEPFGVPWHQDSESPGDAVYTVGVYLVGSGDNPLRVVRGSHRLGQLPPADLSAAVAEHRDEVVTVHARAGDVVVHDLRLIHASGRCGATSRFTIFFEFRSVDDVRANPEWDEHFLAARRLFIPAAVRARALVPELLEEDRRRGFRAAEALSFWRVADLPPTIDLRIPQARDRWCASPSAGHAAAAVAAFDAGGLLAAVARDFGVSEEALFKWLCGARRFPRNARGRHLDDWNVLHEGDP